MAKKNERAKPGSGVKHDKHAPTKTSRVAATQESANDDSEVPSMDNTKAEIIDYCEAHEIEIGGDWNKAELLDAIEND